MARWMVLRWGVFLEENNERADQVGAVLIQYDGLLLRFIVREVFQNYYCVKKSKGPMKGFTFTARKKNELLCMPFIPPIIFMIMFTFTHKGLKHRNDACQERTRFS